MSDGSPAAATAPSPAASRGTESDMNPPKEKSEQAGFFARLGLDAPTFLLMFKASLAPTIALAMLRSPAVSAKFTTMGYVIPIVSAINIAFLPRGRFLQMLLLNLFSLCVGAALALLVFWSSLQARLHTLTGPEAPPSRQNPFASYNSSQSAVSALWLFFNTWLLNVVRAKMPAFNIAAIMYSILLNISCIYSPFTSSMTEAYSIVKELLTAMLVAIALSTGVSLLVVPISSRTVVFAELKQYLGLLQGSAKAQGEYLRALETADMFAPLPSDEEEGHGWRKGKAKKGTEVEATLTEEAKVLRRNVTKLMELHGKLQSDAAFVERDGIWGKLSAEDLNNFRFLLRDIAAPIVGMTTIIDIFQRVSKARGWMTVDDAPEEAVAEEDTEKQVWNEMMKLLQEPYEILSAAMHQGLEHAGLVLEILPRPKDKKSKQKKSDVEEQASGTVSPGDTGFAAHLDGRFQLFHSKHDDVIQAWMAKERSLKKDATPEMEDSAEVERVLREPGILEQRSRTQLYVLLYMVKLMRTASIAVQDLVAFADKKVEDGTMSRSHILLPSVRRLRRWLASVFTPDEGTPDQSANLVTTGLNTVYLGDGYNRKKDPEHLPPTNFRQRFGNVLRKISHFLGSEESAMAFRAACATMSVGIIAYLENTRIFFMEQRLVWAMIIIAISMTITSGQSIFGFVCRIGGTLTAMIAALIAWYIVDGKAPGVIVFAWLFMLVGFYCVIKFQRLATVWVTSVVTMILILGYELQVELLGAQAAAASGQPIYPIYELAPYRLATVAGGCFVAFIWTVLPSPLSDRAWLRRDLSKALYLLANFFSVVNRSLKTKLLHNGGEEDVPDTPAYKLKELRTEIFSKLMLLLPSLRDHARWQKWEPDVGGRFPREIYEDIIMRCTRITHYLAIIAHTLSWPSHLSQPGSIWLSTLSSVLTDLSPTEFAVISTLTLLSNSMLSGQSLPPSMRLPRPYELSRRVESMRGELLEKENASQHGYAEFAVLQVCASLVYDDIEGVVRAVEQLVGVVDFSFRVDGSNGTVTLDDSPHDHDAEGKGKVD